MRKKNNTEQDFILSLIRSGFFQTAKDFTECMGTMSVLLKFMNPCSSLKVRDPHNRIDLTWAFRVPINIYVVGDGRFPQTGYMLAKKLPLANVWSIDPMLRSDFFEVNHRLKNILLNNQKLFKGMIEDFEIPQDHTEMSIIVGVHNHGPVKNLWKELCKTSNHVIYISLPCCYLDVNLDKEPDYVGDDPEIISPKRTIYLWHHQKD